MGVSITEPANFFIAHSNRGARHYYSYIGFAAGRLKSPALIARPSFCPEGSHSEQKLRLTSQRLAKPPLECLPVATCAAVLGADGQTCNRLGRIDEKAHMKLCISSRFVSSHFWAHFSDGYGGRCSRHHWSALPAAVGNSRSWPERSEFRLLDYDPWLSRLCDFSLVLNRVVGNNRGMYIEGNTYVGMKDTEHRVRNSSLDSLQSTP